jgi:hypothetical protein
MRKLSTALLVLGLITLGGCSSGNRLTSLADADTDEGKVSLDGTLIRKYESIKLRGAYEGFQKFAKGEGWEISRKTAKARQASVKGKAKDGAEYTLTAWSPKDKPSELGIKIKPEDRFKASDLLDKLEKALGAKRYVEKETK